MAANVFDSTVFVVTMAEGTDNWSDVYNNLTFLGAYGSLETALNELQCAYEGTVGELLANGYTVCSTEYTDESGYSWDSHGLIPPRGIIAYTISYNGIEKRYSFTVNVVDKIK